MTQSAVLALVSLTAIAGTFPVVSGCTAENGSAAPVARADFAATLAGDYCDAIARCCDQAGITPDRQACVTNVEMALAEFTSEDGPGTVWNSSAAGQCIQAFTGAFSTCHYVEGQVDLSVCEEIYTGTLRDGEACDSSRQCASGSCEYSFASDGTDGEVCVSKASSPRGTPGSPGDPCDSTCDAGEGGGTCSGFGSVVGSSEPEPVFTCYRSDGLFCDFSTQVCSPLAGLGEACVFTEACAVDLFCDETLEECVPRKPDGESCESDSQCQTECWEGVCGPLDVAQPELCAGAGLLD